MKYKEVDAKYVQVGDDWTRTRIRLARVSTDFCELYEDGRLMIKDGFLWDGCSGPTLDDDTNMVPGRNHDCKYKLIRLGLIPMSCREVADRELKEEILERGLERAGKNPIKRKFYEFRAWYYYEGVDHWASWAARRDAEPKVKEAK